MEEGTDLSKNMHVQELALTFTEITFSRKKIRG
jgi:hypothetical protein